MQLCAACNPFDDWSGKWEGEKAMDRAAEVADYIAAMTDDMAGMARENGLPFLCLLLEMTALEAASYASSKSLAHPQTKSPTPVKGWG